MNSQDQVVREVRLSPKLCDTMEIKESDFKKWRFDACRIQKAEKHL
jgi:hypothetical protein